MGRRQPFDGVGRMTLAGAQLPGGRRTGAGHRGPREVPTPAPGRPRAPPVRAGHGHPPSPGPRGRLGPPFSTHPTRPPPRFGASVRISLSSPVK